MGVNKQTNPLVSVIIPTYNRAEVLRRCLESLTKQTFKTFEVLVCDDGSTDHTASIVEEYSEHLDIVYDYESNFGGPARPRNRGMNLARSKYLAFLDSDDWWAPEKLEKSLPPLEDGADIVFHDLYTVTSIKQTRFKKRVKSRQTRKNVYIDLLCYGGILPQSSVVVKTELLRQIGGFCEDRELIAKEDYDAWLRIAQKTNRFKRISGCYGYYWAGDGRISGLPLKTISRLEIVYQRHLNNLEGKDKDRALAMLSYKTGRMYQIFGNWARAVPLLKKSLIGNSSFVFRLKSLFLLSGYIVRKIAGVAVSLGD